MKTDMTVDQARAIARLTKSAIEKWGRHASLPVTVHELMIAVTLLYDAPAETPEMAELTKLRRQLAACENRHKARDKREQKTVDDAKEKQADYEARGGKVEVSIGEFEVPDNESTLED